MPGDVVCIIPARYGSSRLPGKPLCEINGLPLIMWVYNCAKHSGAFDRIVVATDDKRIGDVVSFHGGEWVMTSPDHHRGTDRVFEASRGLQCPYIVNLQGDEPHIPAEVLIGFVQELKKNDDNSLLTVASHATMKDRDNPNVVKVVLGHSGDALYFSRSPIPYDCKGEGSFLKHKGIYGFTAESLRRYCGFPQGELEKRESLEQLRALEYGMKIRCLIYDFESTGIDTLEDLQKFRLQVSMG
ncbi:MAG: 3-deoxy-manno-octulosonate cytidylyltransferase [Fibrobacter sp.]|nr:3-deoxy-manno-octulosonate cytidylyltransferase [Fibrobacter sp.]